MRIAILGDLQNDTVDNIKKIADDINTLSPDYVIALGDYGMYNKMGTLESFRDIAEAFRDVKCEKFVPLLGNHDVQFENGEIRCTPGTVYANYEKAFGCPPDNRIIETENLVICCVHLNPQTKDRYIHINECTVSDDRFEDIKNKLDKINNKPIIMITHTPPSCAEILCVPGVHIRATNAYLDQDHDIFRWEKLARDNRNIVMWFSGHYHMGHDYPKSINIKDGLAYMTTGCPVCASRDGQLHSRIIDTDGKNIIVRTYDHNTKALRDNVDYSCPMDYCRGEYTPTNAPLCIGSGNVINAKMDMNGKLYIMTDNGYLWETDLMHRYTAGTIHYSQNYTLDDFILSDNSIYRICGDKMFRHHMSDPQRFMREYDHPDCRFETSDIHTVEECTYTDFHYDKDNNSFVYNNKSYRFLTDEAGTLWIKAN